MLNDVGKSIRLIRTVRGQGLAQLAQASGLSSPFLSLVESGKRSPSVETLQRIAVALGVPGFLLIALASGGYGVDRTGNSQADRLMGILDRLRLLEGELADAIQNESESKSSPGTRGEMA